MLFFVTVVLVTATASSPQFGWNGQGWNNQGWNNQGWNNPGWYTPQWNGQGSGQVGAPRQDEKNKGTNSRINIEDKNSKSDSGKF